MGKSFPAHYRVLRDDFAVFVDGEATLAGG